jgi:hypothetical protein
MKKSFYSLIFSLLTLGVFAQSASIDPNYVQIPKVSALPGCVVADKGKTVYNNTDNKMYYCNGTAWQSMTPAASAGPGWGQTGADIINTNSGKVEIGTSNATTYKFNVVNPGNAIFASSTTGTAIRGVSTDGSGISGVTYSPNFTAAVSGISNNVGSPGGYFTAPFFALSPALVTGFGNVGLGTSTPKKRLEINGAIKVTGAHHESFFRIFESDLLPVVGPKTHWKLPNDLTGIANIVLDFNTISCNSYRQYEIYLPPLDGLISQDPAIRDYYDYTGQTLTFLFSKRMQDSHDKVDIYIYESSLANGRGRFVANFTKPGSCINGNINIIPFCKIIFDGTDWLAVASKSND